MPIRTSIAIDFLGWYGAKIRAIIEGDYFKFANSIGDDADWGHSWTSDQLDYISGNRTKWSCKRIGNEFIHAPEKNGSADWNSTHKSKTIHYLTWDEKSWIATYDGKQFTHTMEGTNDYPLPNPIYGPCHHVAPKNFDCNCRKFIPLGNSMICSQCNHFLQDHY